MAQVKHSNRSLQHAVGCLGQQASTSTAAGSSSPNEIQLAKRLETGLQRTPMPQGGFIIIGWTVECQLQLLQAVQRADAGQVMSDVC